MKLYPKNLGSLEALKREKIRLRYERMHTKASDLNPIAEIGRGSMSGSAKSGMMSTAMELLGSTSRMQTALALGKPLLALLRKRRDKAREIRYAAGLPRKKSKLKQLAAEIVVSYIIGKAVQVSVHAVQLYLRRRKAKNRLTVTTAY